jgi:N6-L-threonylcarbamoyladenine synthase
VAATVGPGLIGALLVGVSAAKSLALAWDVPFIGVNHLEAHLYAALLDDPTMELPVVVLLVSGGHTMLIEMRGHGEYALLGQTIDDAAGEAFDKVAAMLGLPYPGGPSIERVAASGNARAYDFPRAFLREERLDFSFSGLKTAVRYQVAGQGMPVDPSSLAPHTVTDLAASFQQAVIDCLVGKSLQALAQTQLETLCVAGGVAANLAFRRQLEVACRMRSIALHIPPLKLCTDNAVMGALAVERLKAGLVESLDLDAYPGLVRGH